MSETAIPFTGGWDDNPAPQHTSIDLTAKEVQTLICAMAGNFPVTLNGYRMPLLRKLARASVEVEAMS